MAWTGRTRGGAVLAMILAASAILFLMRAPGSEDSTTRTSEARPNVVVVLIDTLRPDHLGLGGYPRESAPFLGALAENSHVFERVTSTSSWTAPSTASLFTSLDPPRHGVTVGFFANKVLSKRLVAAEQEPLTLNRLPEGLETLPEIYRRQGYRTFGLAANINIGPEIGFDRGFDRFERLHKGTAQEIHAKLRSWRRDLEGEGPYLLYLHLNDVHEPYHDREPWYEPQVDELEDRRARYLSEIGYVDDMLRQLHAELVDGRHTLFVVLSDHGEEFMDHGFLSHGARLYEELTRVLWLVHGPSVGILPGRFQPNVSLLDVLPTLLELCDLAPVPDRAGISLAPVLRKTPEAASLGERLVDRPHFAQRMGPNGPPEFVWSVMVGPWKLIETLEGTRELYDHREDPAEHHDRLASEPEIAARLGELLERYQRGESLAAGEAVQLTPDDELLEHLRSLGYVH